MFNHISVKTSGFQISSGTKYTGFAIINSAGYGFHSGNFSIFNNKVFHERVFELSIDDAYSIVKEIAQFENEFVADSSLHAIKKTEKKKVLSYLLSRDVLEPHPDYGRELVKIKVSLFKEWLRKNE